MLWKIDIGSNTYSLVQEVRFLIYASEGGDPINLLVKKLCKNLFKNVVSEG